MIKTELVSIQCPECGDTEFEVPQDVKDDDFIKCNQCGLEMMMADLREVGLEQAREVIIPEVKNELEKNIKKSFKGLSSD